jgi:hypothetical protein
MDFLDEKCLIFDNEDENKFVYTEIHQAFRELVRPIFLGPGFGDVPLSLRRSGPR